MEKKRLGRPRDRPWEWSCPLLSSSSILSNLNLQLCYFNREKTMVEEINRLRNEINRLLSKEMLIF